MLSFLVIFIIVLPVLLWVNKKWEFESKDGMVVASLLISVFGGMIVGDRVWETSPKEYFLTETDYLVSVKTGDSLHGSFFLGTGEIDSQKTIEYYIEKEGLEVAPMAIPKYESNVRISEDILSAEDGRPRLEVKCPRVEGVLKHFSVDFSFKKECIHLFHVPPGSVKSGVYDFD